MLKDQAQTLTDSLIGSLAEAMVSYSIPTNYGREFNSVDFEHIVHTLFPLLVKKTVEELNALILKEFEE